MDEIKIQLLVDRAEISDLLIRYTTCLDTKDWKLLHSCFTDEVEIDFSSIGIPLSTTSKVDNFIAFLSQVLGRARLKTQHLSTNHVISVEGNSAVCTSYVFAQHYISDGEGGDDFVVRGYYTDTLVRTFQGWRISKRKFTVAWTTGNSQLLT